jgi:hypothetical protein
VAGCLHLAATTTVFIIGRFSLLPSQFDRSGFGAFASDSFFYQEDIISLTDKLKSQGPVVWLKAVAPLHIKLYSLSDLVFSHWAAPNVLTIEPLNLFYYLATLGLVYKLGETVFDRRTGLASMIVMALWPSFLMHTTQLIRDPLLFVAILIFVLVVAGWLMKPPSLRRNLMAVVPAVLATLTIWIVRLAMWDAVRAIVLMGFLLLVVRQVRERRFLLGPLVSALILSIAILIIPHSKTVKSQQRREADVGRPMLAERVADLPVTERIDKRRQAFAKLNNSKSSANGSNIDNQVELNGFGDFVRYLPRAAEIGFFAPFPYMWFVRGTQVGLTGRMLSGLETLITYVLEILAVFGLWYSRKNLGAWLLALTTASALTALGFIVLNIGSLYRFRYPFLMFIVMLAVTGTLHIVRRGKDQPTAGASLNPAASVTA